MKTKNLTISLDEDLIKAGKRYAKLQGTSIDELFRDFLRKRVVGATNDETAEQMMEALDEAVGDSKGKKWSREDAYPR
jgi:hypothetical protein